MNNKIIKIIIGIALLIGVFSVYLLLTIEIPKKPLANTVNDYNDEVHIGGDFELIDQDNKVFSIENLKGKLSLVYFGFTYCPDICPMSLHKMTQIIDTLEKYKINIVPIFITIDPERDRPENLKEFLKNFNPKFIALTGNDKQIKEVADKYKVYFSKANTENKSNDYMIDHSSFIYLIDRQGKYLKHFYLDTSAEEIIEYIRIYNSQNKN